MVVRVDEQSVGHDRLRHDLCRISILVDVRDDECPCLRRQAKESNLLSACGSIVDDLRTNGVRRRVRPLEQLAAVIDGGFWSEISHGVFLALDVDGWGVAVPGDKQTQDDGASRSDTRPEQW